MSDAGRPTTTSSSTSSQSVRPATFGGSTREPEGGGPITVLVVHPSVEMYGADRMLLESVRAMVQAGMRAVVVLPHEGPLVGELRRLGAEITFAASPILRKSAISPLGIVRLVTEAVRALPKMWQTISHVQAHVIYVNTLTIPLWIGVARVRGMSVLCHVHEAEDDLHPAVRLGLSAPLALSSVVIANSLASRAALVRSLPFMSERIRVLYNGVEGPESPTEPRTLLTDPIRLVLVGRVSPRKGTDIAVSALQLLVAAGLDVTLDLVGSVFVGYEWFEAQVREQVHMAALDDRVSWRGVTRDPWGALEECDIALVPSRQEPFGNTAVEAQLAIRPLVAADAQGLREIVTAGINGELVESGSPASLAEGVKRLLADWPQARTRAMFAAAEARERFSPERYRSQIVEIVVALGQTTPARRRWNRLVARD